MTYTMVLKSGDWLPVGGEETEDGPTPGWWYEGNRITTVDAFGGTTVVKLPRGRPRVSMFVLGSGRAQLVIGGFTTTTVAVTGPVEAIQALREEVL